MPRCAKGVCGLPAPLLDNELQCPHTTAPDKKCCVEKRAPRKNDKPNGRRRQREWLQGGANQLPQCARGG